MRLGEIGELGFTASWLGASPFHRKQSSTMIKNFKPAEEEEWSVEEPVASPPVERTEPPLRWIGSKRVSRGKQDDEDATLNSTPPEKDYDAAPMSSDFGQDVEQANPSSHGHDEMQQGAIEDGPKRKGGRSRTHQTAEPTGMRSRSSDGNDATPISGLVAAGVTGWLQKLGLGKYSELFELHEVDTEVLPLLTLDDLREIGVDAVGARRKIFSHIQELR